MANLSSPWLRVICARFTFSSSAKKRHQQKRLFISLFVNERCTFGPYTIHYMVNSVVVEERSEDSASAAKPTSNISTSMSQPGKRSICQSSLAKYDPQRCRGLHSEFQRSDIAKEKRQTRKGRADNRCQTCGRGFHARIGLLSHLRTHRSASIKS